MCTDKIVKQVGPDRFEISSFVMPMPHLVYEVEFFGGKAHVVSREGFIGTDWDGQAIQGVQMALVAGAVQQP